MAPKLNIVIGSTRPGRIGPKVGHWLAEAAKAHGGFEVELVDLADLALPLLDEPAHPVLQRYEHDHTKRWSESVASADAFVFITPEYDYFPPASLINSVQVLMREWAHKPAGVISYGGVSGGLRAAQVLRQLLSNVNLHALPQTVPVPFVMQSMGEDGAFRPTDPVAEGARGLLDELHRWALALKPLRPQEAAPQDKAA